MKINDVLEMDFNKEIEAVISIGEYDEKSATEEINNYIVTEKIAKYMDDFIDYFMTNKKETCVWISGFYGSGKSYMAKIIGYLLENPDLMGVPARELFKDRLTGLEDKPLLENAVESLGRYKTKIITFDLSGENIINSLYKQLLLNFLKSIGLTKDFIGYIEYQIMKTNKYDEFLKAAEELSEDSWEKTRKNTWTAPQVIRKAWQKVSDEEVENIDYIIDNVNQIINSIDADGVVKELDAFLEMNNDYDRVVFIVDEVSEAIDKDHIDISELRGAAQHLSENNKGKYWFLATAQEKLDHILSRKNIDQHDMNVLTDRFQLKIHLSSAQVDKVIKERILSKTEEGKAELAKLYDKENGKINELSNLKGNFNTNVKSKEEFVDYYPFFNYQMRLLKNFLFSVFQQAQAGGSERGMLVTIDRLLKKDNFFEKETGEFVTAYQLENYGLPIPQSELEEKFSQAQTDLMDEGNTVDGQNLMRTIFFLEKSEDLKRTVDNVVKAYNNDLSYIGELKPDFEEALQLLEEKNYVLEENQEYKITSDEEEKLMQEMNMITVSWENRVEIIRNVLKEMPFITKSSNQILDGKSYDIAIKDEQDNLLSRKKGDVSLVIYNILNVDDDIERELDDKKNKYVDLDEAVIIPQVDKKDEIDRLTRKIHKYRQIVSRYRNTTDDEIKNVIDSFNTILGEKEKELEALVKESYYDSYLIYDFNEEKLDKNNIQITIDEIESKMIDRTFSKRLKNNLNESVARKFLTVDNDKLKEYCNNDQFEFFDGNGSFIGENLRVVDEINQECQSKNGRNGSGLYDEFTKKPYGWEYGDIAGTLAALMRAGKLKIKFEGNNYRDYSNEKVKSIFDSVNRFKKAKFYTIIDTSLEPNKKQDIVDFLLNVDRKGKIDIDYNDNDYEVVNSVTILASRYISDFMGLKDSIDKSDRDIIENDKNEINVLKSFAGKNIDDMNLEEEANEILNNKDDYEAGIKYIVDLENFIKNKYREYKKQDRFISEIKNQIKDVADNKKENLLELLEQFETLKEKSIVDHIDQLSEKYNKIRQEFNQLFASYFAEFKKVNQELLDISRDKKQEIEAVSIEENRDMYQKINNYINRCEANLAHDFELSKSEPKEKNTNSTLKEIIPMTELNRNRIKEVENFIPEKEIPVDKKVYKTDLPRETTNLNSVKNKLKRIVKELDEEEYDSIEIRLN